MTFGLWTSTEVTQLLRRCCMQCGQEHPAGMLCRHIHEAHLSGHRFVEFYFETLVPAISKILHSDFQCDLCSQVFNLPPDATQPALSEPRAVLVQTHLRGNCPVILQSSILLATALHGGRLGYEWSGPELPGPNQGDLPVFGTAAGPKSEAAAKSESTETTSHRRQEPTRSTRSRSTRGRPTETDAIPPSTGPSSAASRAQLELAAKHRLFHPVFPAGQRGLTPELAGVDTEMASETPPGTGDGTNHPAPTPVPAPSSGPLEPGHEGITEQAGGCPVPPLPGEESHPGGHELAFPALGHGQEAAGDRQEEGHHDAEDVGASDGAGGGISGPGPCGAIPGAGSKQPADGSSMETPAELALQQALRPAGGHDALLGVDGGGNVPEDSHTTTK